MISRRTIYALLLALLIGLALVAWNGGHHDGCDGLTGAARDQMQVEVGQAGRQAVAAPCSSWLVRQPRAVQGFCFADAALGVVFLLSMASDMRRTVAERTALRRG